MFYIKIASFGFRCHATDVRVCRGDVYMEDENGNKYHISQLPARRLIPIKQYKNGSEIAVKSN